AVFDYDIGQGVSTNTDRQSLQQSLDTLRVLADNTDGRAIVNRNDIGTGMKQIMRDESGYYLLGYTSSAAPTDGKFHTIDVRVKRPGVEVRARKGYWAYTEEDVARATAPATPGPAPAISKALNGIAEPDRGHSARFWVGTSRGDNGLSRVTFVWEPVPPEPGASQRESAREAAARVRLTATAPDGHPLFHGDVPDHAPMPASFDAPPGPVELRMIVEGAHGQVVDSSTRDITVPDFSRTQVSIATPRVYRTRTAHEMMLVRNDPNAAPTADRDFSRAERLLIRFDAYSANGAAPDVTGKLLNRAGRPMADVPIQATPGKPFQIDFPLASLAAGEYILELDAKTPSGTAQQMVAFKVGA
ncbi:MAG TPA: hypothetical protein VG871_15655, partial [Vicinamibacterales bacterium]|nr:hypothetical protein [Vicinamibacterales bacterium]